MRWLAFCGFLALAAAVSGAYAAEELAVRYIDAADLKPVAAEVGSVHRALARARIGGTILELRVTEGEQVRQGDVLAIVSDPKQPLSVDAMNQRIKSLEHERAQVAKDVERYQSLLRRGAISQMKVDALSTRLASLNNDLKALKAERDSAVAHQEEGAVLAPMSGRVLRLPLPAGNVVMPGETVAELTAGDLVLKIRVPERHARFLKIGSAIRITSTNEEDEIISARGVVNKIYPEVENGRVMADVTLADLSQLFIGERMTAYIPTASRKAIYIPGSYVTRRHGLNYVTLKSGGETVVELGLEDEHGVEVLSGLRAGDVLVRP